MGTDSKQVCSSKYPAVITVNQWDALNGRNSTVLILVLLNPVSMFITHTL